MVQKKMSKAVDQRAVLLVGGSADCADIEYATGFRAPDPVVFLQKGARKTLVVSELELGRAGRVAGAHGVTVLSSRMVKSARGRRSRVADWAAWLVRREELAQVTVPAAFPHGIAARLDRAGVRVCVARGDLFPTRAVKTHVERRLMQDVQQAAVIAMRAALHAIGRAAVTADGLLRHGGRTLTSEALRAIINVRLLEHQCFCRDTIVAGGPVSADPHEIGHGALRAGEPIVIDIFPQHLEHGYWGDLTRTVLRGPPTAELRRMYNAVKAAQSAALAAVRPGVRCATVHRAATAVFARRGYPPAVRDGRAVGFIHGTGHGVGLAIHESPVVGLNDTRLRSGHVITIEPGLYYPRIGGIRIEDTIVVAPNGWRYLVPCEKRFEL